MVIAGLTAAHGARGAELIPPSAPSNLTASAAGCAQVDLAWSASVDNSGGSGVKAYIIYRSEPGKLSAIAIGAGRTSFSDTNLLKSAAPLTYYVIAQDYDGNRSPASNSVSVSTAACPMSLNERVAGAADLQPLGKAIAAWGNRSALVLPRLNAQLTFDTWLHLRDEDTGLTSQLLLHGPPGYRQIETDYVFTSPVDLWALSFDPFAGGKVQVSEYRLNGSPIPTSATLLSARTLGDAGSFAKSMIRLKSGGLVVAWNQDRYIKADGSVDCGFAYRSPSGVWTVHYPVTIPSSNGGSVAMSEIALAQHPSDDSIWAFLKRDAFGEIAALHFTESTSGINLDWVNPAFIANSSDGLNGPQQEFPFLAAASDPTRGAILLAYQNHQERFVFVDPLLNDMNSIFLKEATATVARIAADGTKSFIGFPHYFERGVQFGFSAASDGSLWLTYQPIRQPSLTWNEVFTSRYVSGAWTAPVLVGWNYEQYNASSAQRDPGMLASRRDSPEVAFRTPDLKVHTFFLPTAGQPGAADTTPPTTSISSPTGGASVSGVVAVAAQASDNIGVTRVDLLVDGVVRGSKSASPYTFSWDSTASGAGPRSLHTVAYDAAGNSAQSQPVSVTVTTSPTADKTPPAVSITAPAAGSTVPRNSIVTVACAASDNVAVTRVDVYAGKTLVGSRTSAPYSFSWTVPAKNNASYTLKAVAVDAAGNSASASIGVTAK